MDNRTTKRIRLLSAVPVLGLAFGILSMSAASAGAATTPAHATSVPNPKAHGHEAPAAARGAIHVATNHPASPRTCTPNDLPYRFSGTTWTTPWLEKVPNGCQSVWATSGQTFDYALVNVNGVVFDTGVCQAGTCQLWNPASNYAPFYVWDYSDTATSVNIFY